MATKGAAQQRRERAEKSPVYDPKPSLWKFDLRNIPTDAFVSDYVVGALELARDRGMINYKGLAKYDIVYGTSGRIRADRVNCGQPFLDPDGKAVAYERMHLNGGRADKYENSAWSINTIDEHPFFYRIARRLFDPVGQDETTEDEDGEVEHKQPRRKTRSTGSKSKHAAVASSRSRSIKKETKDTSAAHMDNDEDSELDLDDSESDDSSIELLGDVPRFKCKIIPADANEAGQLKLTIDEQKAVIEAQDRKIEYLQSQLKEMRGGTEKIISKVVTLGTDVIESVLKSYIAIGEKLDDRVEGLGSSMLKHCFETTQTALKDFKKQYKLRSQLSVLTQDPNGPLAKQAATSDVRPLDQRGGETASGETKTGTLKRENSDASGLQTKSKRLKSAAPLNESGGVGGDEDHLEPGITRDEFGGDEHHTNTGDD